MPEIIEAVISVPVGPNRQTPIEAIIPPGMGNFDCPNVCADITEGFSDAEVTIDRSGKSVVVRLFPDPGVTLPRTRKLSMELQKRLMKEVRCPVRISS